MSVARIANRMPRAGRCNPGEWHLSGSGVTAKMQRQYEDILDSLRHYHRYRSDAKRKQVAAATVRKLAHHNPLNQDERRAEEMAESFHGRPVREIIELEEREVYTANAGVLGELEALYILTEDGRHSQKIEFDFDEGGDDNILVMAADDHNIEFAGGDQEIEWQKIEGASHAEKFIVLVGPVCEIDYFADKHHLGDDDQKYGSPYYHYFGDEGGDLPWLAYDTRNVKLILVGGDYTVEPEGITG